MKKQNVLFVLFLTSFLSLKAQTSEFNQRGLHIGVTYGFNSVWIINQNTYGSRELEYRPKFGSAYGAEIGYSFTRHLGIQIEGFYSNQGQKYSDQIKDSILTRNVDLKYFYGSFMLKYMGGKAKTQFYFMIGPQYGIKNFSAIQYNDKDFSPQNININLESVNNTDFFEKYDLRLASAIGADIKLSDIFYLSTGLRFYYGLRDINSAPYRIAPNEFKPYDKSTNAFGGINVGFHYMISRHIAAKNPKFN